MKELKPTYTAEEIADALHLTKRAITGRAEKEDWPYEEETCRGGKRRLYRLMGLPKDVMFAVMDTARRKTPEEAMEEVNRKGLSIDPKFLGTDKMQMVHAYTEMQNVPYGVKKDEWVRLLAESYGKHPTTLYRWEARIKKDGGLKARKKKNYLEPEFSSHKFDPEALEWGMAQILHGIKENNRPNTRWVYENLVVEAGRRGWKIGSEKSFYRHMNTIPEPLLNYASGGKQALLAEMPRIELDLSKFQVLERLVGDQHLCDYQVVDTETGAMVTPVLYAWVDLRSRYFPGIYPSVSSYNSYDVGMSLRYACRFGIPKEIHTDNGKPELSAHVRRVRADLGGRIVISDINDVDALLVDPDMGHRLAKPRNPQAKINESLFWHAIESPLLKRQLPGYAKRRNDPNENLKIQNNLNRLHRTGGLLSIEEFYTELLSVIDEWHQHKLTTDPIVPEDYFFKHLADSPRFFVDEKTLDFIFLPATRRKVRKGKVRIKLPGHGVCIYHAQELYALSRKTGKPGIQVEIRYNPYKPESVFIVDPESRDLICIADLWEKTNPKSAEALSSKYRAQQRVVSHNVFLRLKFSSSLNSTQNPYLKTGTNECIE